jgi:threonine synthase
MFVKELKCLKCGQKYAPEKGLLTCKKCGGKLEILYDYDAILEKITKDVLERRKNGVWKYLELLPVADRKHIVSLWEGGTPLLEGKNLSRSIGAGKILLKDETRNPTSSFKDRMMSVGISKAVEFNAKAVVTASSGNAAISLAAYAAKAGIECYAFVPAEAPTAKLAQLMIYGALAVKAVPKGIGDPTYKLMRLAQEKYGWMPLPSSGAFNPYHVEGLKTMSYEVCEQLNWKTPDWVIIPVGAGTLLSGNAKGYFEFKKLGLIEEVPRIVAIQAEGCAPLVRGFKENIPPYEIPTWENPRTIAGGLVDPYPWDADTAIPYIKNSKGTAETVSDEEILKAEKMLAKEEGIFAEPSGAAGLAGFIKLVNDGAIDRSDVVVIEVTGGGLKDQKAALQLVQEPPTIEPELEQFEKIIKK